MSKEIRLKLGSAELEYSTDQAALKAIGNVVYDIISPISEGFGALGDKVRIYRAKSVVEILSEAEDKATKRGVKLENISPKFMFQFLEAASADDTSSDDSLKDLWSNLLVGVAETGDAGGPGYINILNQLGIRHAKLLKNLAGYALDLSELPTFAQALLPYSQAKRVEVMVDLFSRHMSEFFDEECKDIPTEDIESRNKKLIFHSDTDDVISYISDIGHKVGVEVPTFVVNSCIVPMPYLSAGQGGDITEHDTVDRDFLSRLGLMNSVTNQGVTENGNSYFVHSYGLTSLGLKFLELVSDDGSMLDDAAQDEAE